MTMREYRRKKLERVFPKKYEGVQRLYKFFDKGIANQLVNKGYSYVVERIGSGLDVIEVYGFIETPELKEYVTSRYSEQDYYYDCRLNF